MRSVFNITNAWFYKDIIAIYILLAVVVMIYITELRSMYYVVSHVLYSLAKQDIYRPD